MRRLRVLIVVVALGFGWTAPVAAQAPVETPAWAWEVLTERLTAWAEGVWSAVAGAETTAPPEDGSGTDLLAPDGGEQAATADDPSTGTEAYPGFDPNG